MEIKGVGSLLGEEQSGKVMLLDMIYT